MQLGDLNMHEIRNIYGTFFQTFKQVWGIPLTVTGISYCADNIWIPKIIKRYGPKGLDNFTILSTPTESSHLKKEEHSLLKISIEIENYDSLDALGDNLMNQLSSHAKKYFWIQNTYRDGINLGVDYFFKRANEIRDPKTKLRHFEDEHAKFLKKHRQLEKSNEFNIEENAMALLIRKGTIFQDHRKRNNLIGNYFMLRFAKLVSRLTKYSQEEIKYATPLEVLDILKGQNIEKTILKNRLKSCVFYIRPKERFIHGSKKAKILYELLDNPNKGDKSILELKGISASLGKAKGCVKIVQDANNFKDFNHGDILVASMTRPEYTRLMKKAGAIVTDEGGITCHAAIVSRELGIPCVIGTKYATQVLNNNESVEVDADAGVIKRLK
ncbi:hypothetical protein GF323_02445 [Candidatus Woesearchaeota archaeon]|nr:hypothetical protein [Candidatus Woesearchaeota archaeon]